MAHALTEMSCNNNNKNKSSKIFKIWRTKTDSLSTKTSHCLANDCIIPLCSTSNLIELPQLARKSKCVGKRVASLSRDLNKCAH